MARFSPGVFYGLRVCSPLLALPSRGRLLGPKTQLLLALFHLPGFCSSLSHAESVYVPLLVRGWGHCVTGLPCLTWPLRPHRLFVLGIGFFTLCFLMTSLGGQFSARRLGDSPFTIRTEGILGAMGVKPK